MPDFDTIVTGLRAWTKNHDLHVRAAVDLLIAQRVWLDRDDFVEAAVRDIGRRETWIDWAAARRFAESGEVGASEGQLAMLRIAVAIGSDQFRLSRLDGTNTLIAGRAFAQALGLKVPEPPPNTGVQYGNFNTQVNTW